MKLRDLGVIFNEYVASQLSLSIPTTPKIRIEINYYAQIASVFIVTSRRSNLC